MEVDVTKAQRLKGSLLSSALPRPSSTRGALDAQDDDREQDRCEPKSNVVSGEGIYQFIDSAELARRWSVPVSWIRDQVRARAEDPLPHVNLGKYVRFLWGSPDLEDWIGRRIVNANNRRVGRVP